MDPEWNVDPHAGFDYKRDFFKSFKEFKSEQERKKGVKKSKLKSDYTRTWKDIKLQEQKIHDYVTHLRVFNKCYLESPMESLLNVTDVSRRLFPWLSNKYPRIEDHEGNKLRVVDDASTLHLPFLRRVHDNLNGKGIVLTISDDHVDNTLRLMRILRFHRNQLPIQIVYYKNLSSESRDKIVNFARTKRMQDLGLDPLSEDLPVQTVYFVDVSDSIDPRYLNKFEGFGNKILAVLFNTFKEMVLLDADTVPMIPPEEFFDIPKYQVNGTIFFKDRKAVEYRPENDLIFFKKMMPSKFDTLSFGINQPSNYSLDRDFFHGLNHYMESGLVVINREQHFFHSLVMAQLNFIYPVSARIYGDKELFWLSFLMLGEERFAFNKHFSAAIGDLTPMDERFKDIGKAKKLKSQEVCSNHPAHISDGDDHTLLWFNSGFKFCGQEFDAAKDFDAKKRYTKFKTLKDFEIFFNDKLVIKYAVIPPSEIITVDNTDGESNRSWMNMRQYCNGYTWCAYSSIGENPEPGMQGLVVEYSAEETEFFGVLGDLWMLQVENSVEIEPKEKAGFDLDERKANEIKKEAAYYNS
ncbi:hypothetical protein CANTEDRAFT_105484 [Yamadazyma tenuis ATCC 10573]|uniref:Nucleotide-diphospho-sugar transferase n=2 Tax=Candida tenuis TaxID=2315449 RepID=G3B313_CANTC|nr:uncharacterized protein CANTEDRAFT_105484 [Yamadazyma tenuis ATCC 10573]EGV64054.1 hypothetical protein CANTEDRAFT_105484 [Yamadazyma tenuis ATCC 10573]